MTNEQAKAIIADAMFQHRIDVAAFELGTIAKQLGNFEKWMIQALTSVEQRTAKRCADIAKGYDESTMSGGETAVAISLAIAREFGLITEDE